MELGIKLWSHTWREYSLPFELFPKHCTWYFFVYNCKWIAKKFCSVLLDYRNTIDFFFFFFCLQPTVLRIYSRLVVRLDNESGPTACYTYSQVVALFLWPKMQQTCWLLIFVACYFTVWFFVSDYIAFRVFYAHYLQIMTVCLIFQYGPL